MNDLMLVDQGPPRRINVSMHRKIWQCQADKYSLDTETIPRRDVVKSGQEHFRRLILYWFSSICDDMKERRNCKGRVEYR
jgi:hypothetical protein